MTKEKKFPKQIAAWLALAAILIPAAGVSGKLRTGNLDRYRSKISSALGEEVRVLLAHPQYSYSIPVIVQAAPERFRELRRQSLGRGEKAANSLDLVNGYSARLTPAQIEQLLASDLVEYVTEDALLRVTGRRDSGALKPDTYLATIGANLVKPEITGEGVVVAVFDSGVRSHPDLTSKGNSSRILVSIDFTSGMPVVVGTGNTANVDGYGHGSHVAGIVAGNGVKSKKAFGGVAPGASLLDLKVMDDSGVGLTSNLIKAIDWLIADRKYGVRVANLSIGHPPRESCLQDPLCQAVERLVQAGIVTVVSAGNLGKNSTGDQIWGGISSPGNSPAVITVGPVNTRNTLTHADDIATTYGSRGPTYVDNLFKPDLVAPGNAISSLRAKFSVMDTEYPDLWIDDYYIHLSGASMATPYVSGTAALMLQANPLLTPRLVKAILMLTASKLTQPHLLEQGNGLLNVYTAVEMAVAMDVSSRRLIYDPVPYFTMANGERVWSGGAIAFGDQIVYSKLVKPFAQGQLWGDGVYWTDGLSNNSGWANSVFNPGSPIWGSLLASDGVLWVDGLLWVDGVFWGDGLLFSDGVLWVDSIQNLDGFGPSGFMWTEGALWADSTHSHNFRGDEE